MPLNAKLHMATAQRNGRTILTTSFCTQPFKIANITEDKAQPRLQLMLMSSSPGILDGDNYEVKIVVGENCQLVLETQAYQRLFQMQSGAFQHLEVQLKKNSSFSFLPHPVVPHSGSIYQSKNRIFLEENCTLLWGEVLCCGRRLNGEVFQFSTYRNLTEIYRKGKLVVKENIFLRPAAVNLAAMGLMEGFTHQATLLYLNETADVNFLVEEVRALLPEQQQLTAGVSALPVRGLLVRLLGYRAEELFQLLKKIALYLDTKSKLSVSKSEAYVS